MKNTTIVATLIITIFTILPWFSSEELMPENTISTYSQEELRDELDDNIEWKIDEAVKKYNTLLLTLWSDKKNLLQEMILKLIDQEIIKYQESNQIRNVMIFSLLRLEINNIAESMVQQKKDYPKREYSDAQLRSRLTSLQYEVTQNSATEKPYQNTYWENYEAGIYIDIVDWKPLFSSTDKYDSDTGWPSFTNPIEWSSVSEHEDNKLFYTRVEAKWSSSDSHLGHVFKDWPKDKWGLRYCINSASLEFIPKDQMESSWYGDYLYLFE